MSWSAATLEAQTKGSVDIRGTAQTVPEGVDEAYADQLAAVKECIAILSKVVGQDGHKVVVSASGHATPNHASLNSEAESVNISITAIESADTHEQRVEAQAAQALAPEATSEAQSPGNPPATAADGSFIVE